MAKPQVRVTDPNETQEGFNRPAAGENHCSPESR